MPPADLPAALKMPDIQLSAVREWPGGSSIVIKLPICLMLTILITK